MKRSRCCYSRYEPSRNGRRRWDTAKMNTTKKDTIYQQLRLRPWAVLREVRHVVVLPLAHPRDKRTDAMGAIRHCRLHRVWVCHERSRRHFLVRARPQRESVRFCHHLKRASRPSISPPNVLLTRSMAGYRRGKNPDNAPSRRRSRCSTPPGRYTSPARP